MNVGATASSGSDEIVGLSNPGQPMTRSRDHVNVWARVGRGVDPTLERNDSVV